MNLTRKATLGSPGRMLDRVEDGAREGLVLGLLGKDPGDLRHGR